MRLRSFLVLLFGTLGLALGLFCAAPASAQTITIVDTNIQHSREITGRKATEIWYEECVDVNATITIPFTLVAPGDRDLEVWSSIQTTCSDDSRRNSVDSDCRSLGDVTGDRQVTLRVRDLLAPAIPGGADPNNPCASIEKTSINVFLLLMDGTRTDSSDSLSFSVDFEGPDPPELNEVGVGEEQLYADWDGSDSTDIDGYYVFCELIDGSAPPPSTGGTAGSATGGSSGDTASGGTASGGTSNGGSSDGTAGSTASGGTSDGTAGETSGTATGGTTGSPSRACGEVLLVEGQRPPAGVIRSKRHSKTATSGPSGKLENGQLYACGVAGVDSQGNVGVLSAIDCGIPEELTDFYEAYRQAGGQGGGGFCAFDPRRRSSFLSLSAASVVLLLARRRFRGK